MEWLEMTELVVGKKNRIMSPLNDKALPLLVPLFNNWNLNTKP